jgi:hypothetical protein
MNVMYEERRVMSDIIKITLDELKAMVAGGRKFHRAFLYERKTIYMVLINGSYVPFVED